MAASPGSTFTERFAALTDPRMERATEHHLLGIRTIAFAIISGADVWVAMEMRRRQAGVARYLP